MNKRTAKEPQALNKTNASPKGYKNTLDEQQAKRIARRELINREMNKIVKDRF